MFLIVNSSSNKFCKTNFQKNHDTSICRNLLLQRISWTGNKTCKLEPRIPIQPSSLYYLKKSIDVNVFLCIARDMHAFLSESHDCKKKLKKKFETEIRITTNINPCLPVILISLRTDPHSHLQASAVAGPAIASNRSGFPQFSKRVRTQKRLHIKWSLCIGSD